MCTEQWLHADIKLKETIITNEQILADVEEFDKLEKGMNSFALLFYLFALFYCPCNWFLFAFVSEFEAHNLDDWSLDFEGWRLEIEVSKSFFFYWSMLLSFGYRLGNGDLCFCFSFE